MKVTIEFDTGNAAFEDDWEGEVAFVLAQAREKLIALGPEEGGRKLYDSNGNKVGTVKVEE